MFGGIDLADALMWYVALLFSLCAHEAAHAAASNWCGDPSARLMGRLTMDPRKHIDPIGTVVLPLLMLLMPGAYLFGWAKPVPFNPRNLGNMRRDPVIIAVAGPLSNLVMAFCGALLLRFMVTLIESGLVSGAEGGPAHIALTMLFAFFSINIILMLFNLIPVPPLDGHYVLKYFLPPKAEAVMEQIGPWGILFVVLLIAPWVFDKFMPPIESALYWFLGQG